MLKEVMTTHCANRLQQNYTMWKQPDMASQQISSDTEQDKRQRKHTGLLRLSDEDSKGHFTARVHCLFRNKVFFALCEVYFSNMFLDLHPVNQSDFKNMQRGEQRSTIIQSGTCWYTLLKIKFLIGIDDSIRTSMESFHYTKGVQ